jgi:hypothetical protein
LASNGIHLHLGTLPFTTLIFTPTSMAFRAIVPPCMMRSNVCKDISVVGLVSSNRKKRVHALVDNLENNLRITRQKYPYLGVGVHLYLTQAAERSGNSFHVVLSNYKTGFECSGLSVEYPLARFRESNRVDWMGIVREFVFGVVESVIKKHMTDWAEGTTNTATKLAGTVLLEMPDRSGVKVFFEGQGGSANEVPTMVFSTTDLKAGWACR